MSLLAIIDQIEKMILDSEPIAQTRTHLHRLRDQAQALEKEVKARNALARKLGKANATIARLQAKEKEDNADARRFIDLPASQSKILILLSGEDFPVAAFFVADRLGQGRALVQHHLDILLDGKFVERAQGKDLPVWAISKTGRAYLAERDKL
jgi:hypothetical protein